MAFFHDDRILNKIWWFTSVVDVWGSIDWGSMMDNWSDWLWDLKMRFWNWLKINLLLNNPVKNDKMMRFYYLVGVGIWGGCWVNCLGNYWCVVCCTVCCICWCNCMTKIQTICKEKMLGYFKQEQKTKKKPFSLSS